MINHSKFHTTILNIYNPLNNIKFIKKKVKKKIYPLLDFLKVKYHTKRKRKKKKEEDKDKSLHSPYSKY